VFHNPKTEFVMNFLGQVNKFHGRVEGGKVHFATLSVDAPHPSASRPHQVQVFVRPHDLEIETRRNGHPAFPAVIMRVHSAGSNVRMELRTESGELLQAEMPPDRYRALEIGVASQVFVSPRTMKVFSQGQDAFGHGEGI
jgi:sulfate/thiosulfate transport system ATP-binding protein